MSLNEAEDKFDDDIMFVDAKFFNETLRLSEERDKLVALVRIGFLVTINGERADADVVNDPEMRKLLFTILQAKDTAAAIAALHDTAKR
jgi:hypothetical protein